MRLSGFAKDHFVGAVGSLTVDCLLVICLTFNNRAQNWFGQEESDWLIKPKHCDGWRNVDDTM